MKNQPAFPQSEIMASDFSPSEMAGMTLRDYFAAAAMQSICDLTKNMEWQFNEVAEHSYMMADAMLKARE